MDPRGLLRKYQVRRIDGSDGPGGKHELCWYYVLDPTHDPDALAALDFYAERVATSRPALSHELKERVARYRGDA
jgi:hypothetical protein